MVIMVPYGALMVLSGFPHGLVPSWFLWFPMVQGFLMVSFPLMAPSWFPMVTWFPHGLSCYTRVAP